MQFFRETARLKHTSRHRDVPAHIRQRWNVNPPRFVLINEAKRFVGRDDRMPS